MHENREISSTPLLVKEGRSEKAINRNADMHVLEKSDCVVLPMSHPNKGANALAEGGEASKVFKIVRLCSTSFGSLPPSDSIFVAHQDHIEKSRSMNALDAGHFDVCRGAGPGDVGGQSRGPRRQVLVAGVERRR